MQCQKKYVLFFNKKKKQSSEKQFMWIKIVWVSEYEKGIREEQNTYFTQVCKE